MFKSLLTLIIVGCGQLAALGYLPGSGHDTGFRLQDSLAFYHDFQDDQHWYGADQWAVRFDLSSFYGGMPVSFTAAGVWIYLPNPAGESDLTVNLYQPGVHQPDLQESLGEINIPAIALTPGWNQFLLPQNLTEDTLWVVIDYPTAEDGQFISASAVGGIHSFYGINGFFYGMSAANYTSEFLVCLNGLFSFDGTDVEINSFVINGDISPGNPVYPTIEVLNSSQFYADSIEVLYRISTPQETIIDTIPLPTPNQALTPGESCLLVLDEEEYIFQLYPNPAQYSFRATVRCNDDEFSYNNVETILHDIFLYGQQPVLIENFIRSYDQSAAAILAAQSLLPESEYFLMNCFPDVSDVGYYTGTAWERFNYYGLNGYPATVIHGLSRILGYDPDSYDDTLFDLADQVLNESVTYISGDSLYLLLDEGTGIVSADLTLFNEDTYLFAGTADNTVLYISLAEDSIDISGQTAGAVILEILHESDNLSVPYDSLTTVTFQFQPAEFDPLVSLQNCRLFWWVQNSESRQIFHTGYSAYIPDLEYDNVTYSEESDIPSLQTSIRLYPNPLAAGNRLTIDLTNIRGLNEHEVRIYNIRGQLVRRLPVRGQVDTDSCSWDGRDGQGAQVACGIYLVGLWTGRNQKPLTVKKAVLLGS